MMVLEIDAIRRECCAAAARLMKRKQLDEADLEECARLDDALAGAHRLMRDTLKRITLLRLKRRSRAG
jgi:hypothetical protein